MMRARVLWPKHDVLRPRSTGIGGICPCAAGPAPFTLHAVTTAMTIAERFSLSYGLIGGRSGAATYPPRLRSTRPQASEAEWYRLYEGQHVTQRRAA